MITKNELSLLQGLIEEYLKKKVLELTYLGRGACNNLYYLKTDDGDYSVKQERQDKLDSEKNDLTLEIEILKLLEKRGVPFTPRVVFSDKETRLLGYKYISGIPLESNWATLTEEERRGVMSELGRFHALLHPAISLQGSVEMDIPLNEYSVELALAEVGKIIQQTYKQTSALNKITSKLRNYYADNKSAKVATGFLHGDLHHGNIIVYQGKLSGIVDFGKSEFGDIHRDFAHYARHYPDYLDSLIESYETHSIHKLDRKMILFFGLLTDIEKVLYHAKKLTLGEQKVSDKLNIYEKLLNDI